MNSFEQDDPELPDPSDMDNDDYTVMSRCPNCKKMIAEDSEVCPRCGYFIGAEDTPARPSIWFILVITIVFIAMFVAYVLRV